MKTAFDLLMTSPETQVKPCQSARRAIKNRQFDEAAAILRKAALEGRDD